MMMNMKGNMRNRNGTIKVQAHFEPETRFEFGPLAPVPFRGVAENKLEQLKARLLRQLLAPVVEPEMNTILRRAANEAASVAWFTPFPLLVFPTLLEEKAAGARLQHERQREIRQRTRPLLDESVS